MAGAVVLKNSKIAISRQHFDRSPRKNLVWCRKLALFTLPTLQIPTYKNPRWRTAAIMNMGNVRYFSNSTTDRSEIWHDIFAKFYTVRDPVLLRTTALSNWNRKLIRDINGHLENFSDVITAPPMVIFS